MNSFPNELLRCTSQLPSQKENTTVILGAGLAGLSSGYSLVKAGKPVTVFESDSSVGGLSRTIKHGNFRFDLGGHRFHTKNKNTEDFVKNILDGEYVTVPRKSKIYLQNKFFDYPLKPLNALWGLGIPTTVKAVYDYSRGKIRNLIHSSENISLEDWVVSNFGRTMFNIYFKDYSVKVWGIKCSRIS